MIPDKVQVLRDRIQQDSVGFLVAFMIYQAALHAALLCVAPDLTDMDAGSAQRLARIVASVMTVFVIVRTIRSAVYKRLSWRVTAVECIALTAMHLTAVFLPEVRYVLLACTVSVICTIICRITLSKLEMRVLQPVTTKRFVGDGFDLDLSYISERVVAMSLPVSEKESQAGVSGNTIGDVISLLSRHGVFRIFYIDSEPSGVPQLFNEVYLGLERHSVPPIDMLLAFCQQIDEFLSQTQQNPTTRSTQTELGQTPGQLAHGVVAICSPDKCGRTCLFVCAWLLYTRQAHSPAGAIELFAHLRMTRSTKELLLPPSQFRQLDNFCRYLQNPSRYTSPRPIMLVSIMVTKAQEFLHRHGSGIWAMVSVVGEDGQLQDFRPLYRALTDEMLEVPILMEFNLGISVQGDLYFRIFADAQRKELVTSFWLNTSFISDCGVTNMQACDLDARRHSQMSICLIYRFGNQ